MNFNVWNIKEMLSMPSGSGAIKSSSWNNNQTDYSSLSDSQFLFGSQFCPENSETLSAPLDTGTHLRHPKQSQQNSLDSEPSIFTKYQTKPQLFGGGTKDGGLFPLPLSGGKSKGFLEQFEEKKKMAKDKCDSETLCSFISYVTESIHRLQTSVEKSEEHLSSRNQSILDSLEAVAKTLQETTRAQSNLVLEAMQDKGSMEQTILEMQKRLEASQVEFAEMKSSLKHLEVLVMQQSKNSQQLCEQLGQLNIPSILADLKTFLSMPQLQEHVKDSASQTSPALAQSLNFSRQEKSTSGDPIMWQAQPLPAAWNPTVGSLWPREDGVQSEGAKSEILQEEAALTAAQLRTRNKQDKEVQASCEHCALTKTEAKSHGLSLPGHKVPGNKDLLSQRASPPGSLDANNFATSIENSCQEHLAKGMFSCDPCGRGLVTDPKDSIVESGKKGKKQRPRKGRLLSRKVKPTSSKTCAVRSKVQGLPPPVSDPQRPSPGQREPRQQPLCLRQSRSCTKPAGPTQGGAVMPSKTGTAVQRVSSRFSRLPPRDHSRLSPHSLGDHQMSWFSSLDIRGSQSTLYKEQGKNLLYDLAFDSSDDSF